MNNDDLVQKKILCAALFISLTAGCSTLFGTHEGDEPARYNELRYDNQTPIKLKVNKVEVISESSPSFPSPECRAFVPDFHRKNC